MRARERKKKSVNHGIDRQPAKENRQIGRHAKKSQPASLQQQKQQRDHDFGQNGLAGIRHTQNRDRDRLSGKRKFDCSYQPLAALSSPHNLLLWRPNPLKEERERESKKKPLCPLSFDWVTPTGIPPNNIICVSGIEIRQRAAAVPFRSIRARASALRGDACRPGTPATKPGCVWYQTGIPSYNRCFCIWRLSISRNVASTDRIQKLLLLLMMMMATAVAEDAGCKSQAVVYFFSAG